MKPDWDKLIDEFKDSKTSLVADVDCTADGKDLCEKHGVEGFPTIKYGDPNDLQDYKGGRSFTDLKKFAEENLGPTCGPDNVDLCDEDQKSLIDKFENMEAGELDKAIEEGDKKLDSITKKADVAVHKLENQISDTNKRIEAETKKRDDALAKASKKTGLKMMKAVAAAKKKKDEI